MTFQEAVHMIPVKNLAVNNKLYSLPNTHFKGLVLHCATWLVVYIAAESLAKLALPTTTPLSKSRPREMGFAVKKLNLHTNLLFLQQTGRH